MNTEACGSTLTFEIARVTNEDGTSLPKVVKRSSHDDGRKQENNRMNQCILETTREVPTQLSSGTSGKTLAQADFVSKVRVPFWDLSCLFKRLSSDAKFPAISVIAS